MYHRMLIPLDGSPCSEQAAEVGLALAGRLGATVWLTYVAYVGPEDGPQSDPQTEWAHTELHLGETLLEHWARVAQTRGLTAQTRVERGRIPGAILRVADEAGCDLLVMGTHGRSGAGRLLLGSVAEAVIRHAQVPVLLVRAGTRSGQPAQGPMSWRRVLVPIDGGPTSPATLRHGAELARVCGAAVDVIHVLPGLPPGLTASANPFMPALDLEPYRREQQEYAGAVLAEAARQVRDAGVPLLAADALPMPAGAVRIADVIIGAARTRQADVLVLGAHGAGGLGQLLLGSVAQRVTHLAPVPVLLVKEEAGLAERPGPE